eukprot:3650535-Rhodomonas_salina.5
MSVCSCHPKPDTRWLFKAREIGSTVSGSGIGAAAAAGAASRITLTPVNVQLREEEEGGMEGLGLSLCSLACQAVLCLADHHLFRVCVKRRYGHVCTGTARWLHWQTVHMVHSDCTHMCMLRLRGIARVHAGRNTRPSCSTHSCASNTSTSHCSLAGCGTASLLSRAMPRTFTSSSEQPTDLLPGSEAEQFPSWSCAAGQPQKVAVSCGNRCPALGSAWIQSPRSSSHEDPVARPGAD